MSHPESWLDTPSATSSPASEDGPTLYDWLNGPATVPSGPDPARVNLSARQAKALGLLTSGTCGLRGIGWSDSAGRTLSLANRLQRLCSGGIWYRQTWKWKATPLGRRLLAHIASAHRTSDSASTGWPTTRMADGEKNVRSLEGSLSEIARKGGPQDLNQAACLATWPTPMAGTPAQKGYNEAGNTDYSRKVVDLCAWPTPTPTTRDHKDGASDGIAPINGLLGRTAWLTAEMGSGGQLNPEHSRWLMGYPPAWGFCGGTAMQSFQTRQRRSSERT